MKHVILIFIIIVAVLTLWSEDTESKWLSRDTKTHSLIEQGIHQVHVGKYNKAIWTFEKLIKLRPQQPI